MPGKNCPVEQVIEKEKECLKALTALDLDPRNLKVNKDGRPAGCYWLKGKGFFNKITDPNLTEPEEFGNRAGVCKTPGKFFHSFKIVDLLQNILIEISISKIENMLFFSCSGCRCPVHKLK